MLALTELMSGRTAEALAHADAAWPPPGRWPTTGRRAWPWRSGRPSSPGRAELTEAEEALQQALDVLRDNNGWGVANVLYGLGQVARARRDPRRRGAGISGRACPVPADRRAAGNGQVPGRDRRIALTQGDLAVAADSLTESMRLSLATGHRLAIARGLQALAALAEASGDPRRPSGSPVPPRPRARPSARSRRQAPSARADLLLSAAGSSAGARRRLVAAGAGSRR